MGKCDTRSETYQICMSIVICCSKEPCVCGKKRMIESCCCEGIEGKSDTGSETYWMGMSVVCSCSKESCVYGEKTHGKKARVNAYDMCI